MSVMELRVRCVAQVLPWQRTLRRGTAAAEMATSIVSLIPQPDLLSNWSISFYRREISRFFPINHMTISSRKLPKCSGCFLGYFVQSQSLVKNHAQPLSARCSKLAARS